MKFLQTDFLDDFGEFCLVCQSEIGLAELTIWATFRF